MKKIGDRNNILTTKVRIKKLSKVPALHFKIPSTEYFEDDIVWRSILEAGEQPSAVVAGSLLRLAGRTRDATPSRKISIK